MYYNNKMNFYSTDQSIIYDLILPNLDPNSVPYIDSANTVQDRILDDGEMLVGVTGGPPVAASLTGTVDQVNVTNGPGSITLSLPQDIAVTSDPTFNDLTVNHINGKVANDLVTGPASSVADRLASFNGTSGEIIKDSGIDTADVFLRTGTVAATGNFNMNNKELQDVAAIRPHDTNINFGNTTSLALGGIGNIVLGDFTTATANNGVCIGLQNIARGNSVAIGKETIAGTSATVVGYRSSSGSQTDSVVLGHDNTSSSTSADILGVNRSNNQANTLLLGNGSYSNIRSNVGCSLGTSLLPFRDVYSDGSLIGTVNSRLTNDVVSNTSTGAVGNIPSFVSAKVIGDSGIPASSISAGPFLKLDGTSSMLGNINLNTNALTNVTTVNTKTADDLVTSAANGAVNMVATYAGTSKAIQSSGTLITDLATNSALTAGLALKVAKAGDTMSGNLAMGTSNITNIGSISGAVKTSAVDRNWTSKCCC
jgi:hypothetical protein